MILQIKLNERDEYPLRWAIDFDFKTSECAKDRILMRAGQQDGPAPSAAPGDDSDCYYQRGEQEREQGKERPNKNQRNPQAETPSSGFETEPYERRWKDH